MALRGSRCPSPAKNSPREKARRDRAPARRWLRRRSPRTGWCAARNDAAPNDRDWAPQQACHCARHRRHSAPTNRPPADQAGSPVPRHSRPRTRARACPRHTRSKPRRRRAGRAHGWLPVRRAPAVPSRRLNRRRRRRPPRHSGPTEGVAPSCSSLLPERQRPGARARHLRAEDRSLRRHYPDQVRWVGAEHASQPFGTPTDRFNLVAGQRRSKASRRRARLCAVLVAAGVPRALPSHGSALGLAWTHAQAAQRKLPARLVKRLGNRA